MAPRRNSTRWSTLQDYADLIQKLHTLPKLTIAAVNGDALAGGAGLMAACDFAVAADGARIGYPEVLRGLVPSVVMYDLTRLVGDRRARHLAPLRRADRGGRGPRLGAGQPGHEAGGLPRRVDPARRRASSHAGPQAVAAIKRLLDETEGRPKNLRGAAAVSAAIRVSDEAQEGIRAFLEKRPPRWVEAHRDPNVS